MDLDKFANYAFEFYNKKGELIDKIEAPGELCPWLENPEGPTELAILPISTDQLKGISDTSLVLTTKLIPLDLQFNEIKEQTIVGVLIQEIGKGEALRIAKENNCKFYYLIDWDPGRTITVHDVESKQFLYYYNANE